MTKKETGKDYAASILTSSGSSYAGLIIAYCALKYTGTQLPWLLNLWFKILLYLAPAFIIGAILFLIIMGIVSLVTD